MKPPVSINQIPVWEAMLIIWTGFHKIINISCISMSQSQREIQHKKQLSNTLYTHNRKHSRKFTHLNPTEGLVDKGKSLYQAGLLKPALAQF